MENNVTENNNVEAQEADLLDILLDENNREPIVLIDDSGRRISFEQVAIIPYNNQLYCVLKPIDRLENVADDEAIVFFVDEDEEGHTILRAETNEETAINVFDEYYTLVEEEELKAKAKANKN
ncbi:MAG: DUF1292 domain-containing protein [Clostridia bacterium]|nr:DUF1292 domain-containing protein [Clostridia bacterium]